MKNCLLFLLLISFNVSAQDLKQSATTHFNNREWADAMHDYNALVQSEKADSSDWYNLAYCQMQMQQYSEAVSNFEMAKKLGIVSSFADFNISKIYANEGDTKRMYQALEQGVKDGLATYKLLKTDTAFTAFQEDERFLLVLEKVKLNAYPCLTNSDMRHLDFWLGEWDVYFNGNKVGENSITMAEGGCAVHESYTTARNYSGQSINYFDPIDKLWHQHWVGTGGDVYNYLEIDRGDGMLQFQSKFADAAGNISLSRLTFTLNDDGTVSQLFESSYDDGSTWTSGFNGIYKKKK